MTTDTTATERVQETASTAKEEAQNVAATAAEQARNLAGETRQQVTQQLGDQASTQRDKLVGTLRTLGDDLEQMAGQDATPGLAADLAREVADRARTLGTHLDGRAPGQLLDDVRDFARRRPGTFLLGALAAGVVAGRLFRATADGAAAATLAPETPASGTPVPATQLPPTPAPEIPAAVPPPVGTTNPPMPSVTPGQQTMDAP
jgi:hypothetical protein